MARLPENPPLKSPPVSEANTFTKLQSLIQGDANKRGNRISRVLETKRQPPAHQQMDIDPAEGGRSLLHDEHGMPRVTPAPKQESPPLKELPNIPISIKASVPAQPQIARGVPKKGQPSPAAQQVLQSDEDDGFIPPKNNFVNVGQTEHVWYDEKVAGPSEVKQEIIDNNKEVDVEKLQGLDPMADVQSSEVSEVRKQFEKRLNYIYNSVLTQLEDVVDLDQLDQFKSNVLGKNGVFVAVLKQFKKLPPEERQAVGELINSFIDNLKLEFEAKENEFLILTDEEGDEEFDGEGYDELVNEMIEAPAKVVEKLNKDQRTQGAPEPRSEPEAEDPGDREEDPPPAKVSATLSEGQYGVLVDDKLFVVVDSNQDARNVLSRLILGNNVAVERIQLIKRIPIDFGVVLTEE